MQTNRPLSNPYSIDVIIPAFNPGVFFKGCLESCLDQTFKGDYRITIIDDGSTEDLSEIVAIARKKAKGTEINYFRLFQNHGAGYARNVGIHKTSGAFIIFHDADDYMRSDRIEVSYQSFCDEPSQVMCCGNWRWSIDGRLEQHARFAVDHPIERATLLFDFPIASQTVMLKREILDITGLFNENYVVAEDYDLWARVLEYYPNQVKYLHHEMVIHNRHATAYSLSKKHMWTKEYFRILAEMKKKYKMV